MDALTPRGIEIDRTTTFAIQARAGFVSVCTRRLPEPLGRGAWLHVVERLVSAGLKVWPDAAWSVLAVVTRTCDQADAPETTEVRP